MTLFIRSELLGQYGWHGIFSTRQGGCSPAPYDALNLGFDLGDHRDHVLKNHLSLLKAVNISAFPHQAKQVHASHALYCSGEGNIHTQEADALWSDQASCALAVRTADCVPILLADPVTGLFAAVHAGWRGTADRIVAKTVHIMCQQGAVGQNIVASIGPCIGMCCFEINQSIALSLQHSVSKSSESAVRHVENKWYADLTWLNQQQLKMAGLLNSHIETQALCTYCEAERFFSYRRDGAKTGRALAIITAKKL